MFVWGNQMLLRFSPFQRCQPGGLWILFRRDELAGLSLHLWKFDRIDKLVGWRIVLVLSCHQSWGILKREFLTTNMCHINLAPPPPSKTFTLIIKCTNFQLLNFLKALYLGLKSNLKAKKDNNYSSLIYILQKN